MIDMMKVKKALIIDFNFLGDMLMDSGVYSDLKKTYPHLELHAFIWEDAKPAFSGIEVDKIYTCVPGFLGEVLVANNIPDTYDLCVSLHTSFRVSLVMLALDAKIRAGFNYRGRGFLNTIRVPKAERTLTTNRSEELETLLLGITGCDFKCYPKFRVAPHSKRRSGVNIGVHLAVKDNCRVWPMENWVEVLNSLVVTYDCHLHFFGLHKDSETVLSVSSKIRGNVGVYNWCGILDFQALAGEIDKLDLFLCVNSAPMHLGKILETKTVALIDDKSRQVVIPNKYSPYFKALSLEKTTVQEVLYNCADLMEGK